MIAAKQAAERCANNKDLWPLPGLAPMTRVRTSSGDVHAIALRKGDKVQVRSGEYLPIVWLNRVLLDEQFLSIKPDSNPILMRAGSVGLSSPSTDIMVSPRQIVCPTPRTQIDKPVEASELTSRPLVMQLQETGLSYTMFHVGAPADVLCENVYMHFPVTKL